MKFNILGNGDCPFSSIISSDEIPRCVVAGDINVCWGDMPTECPLLNEDIIVHAIPSNLL